MTTEEKIAILKGQIKVLCFKCADTPSDDINTIKLLMKTIAEHKEQLCELLKEKEHIRKVSNHVRIFNFELNLNRVTEI